MRSMFGKIFKCIAGMGKRSERMETQLKNVTHSNARLSSVAEDITAKLDSPTQLVAHAGRPPPEEHRGHSRAAGSRSAADATLPEDHPSRDVNDSPFLVFWRMEFTKAQMTEIIEGFLRARAIVAPREDVVLTPSVAGKACCLKCSRLELAADLLKRARDDLSLVTCPEGSQRNIKIDYAKPSHRPLAWPSMFAIVQGARRPLLHEIVKSTAPPAARPPGRAEVIGVVAFVISDTAARIVKLSRSRAGAHLPAR